LSYKILIDKKVIKDLKKIDKTWQIKIINKIQTTLATNPYSDKKLVGDLSKYYRLRVGDYRVIYSIDEDIVTVEVVKVSHRKDAYNK